MPSLHLVSDLERVCDHVNVLSHGHVTIAGAIEPLLAEHPAAVSSTGTARKRSVCWRSDRRPLDTAEGTS